MSSALAWSGQDKSPESPKIPDCTSCHKTQSLSSSVHAKLMCRDCHTAVSGPGTADIPHPKKLPSPNCTEKCHQGNHLKKPGQSPIYYPDSVHGRAYLERSVKDVAKCWDCHGKHNIKSGGDPESTVNRKNIPLMCSACHENQAVVVKYHIHAETPYQEYKQSVHGKALFEKGLLKFAAVCTDCHGVHDIKGVGEPHLMAKNPETCGGCHILVFNDYKASIHGSEALKGNIDAPLCVDCHGEHKVQSPEDQGAPTSSAKIPDTCSNCHARPEIMRKYGIPEDRIETFIESMHGIAVGFGSRAAANCSSCHGVHDIRPASDALSKVNPANLAATCGRADCHPGMPEKIRASKVHVGPGQKKSSALYWVQKVFVWVMMALILITVIWFVPGFIRKAGLFRRK